MHAKTHADWHLVYLKQYLIGMTICASSYFAYEVIDLPLYCTWSVQCAACHQDSQADSRTNSWSDRILRLHVHMRSDAYMHPTIFTRLLMTL